MTQNSHYTFGDSELAGYRLRALANAYEAATREFILRFNPAPGLRAIDLGCGPGYSTELLHELTAARATMGIEASAQYVEQARARAPAGVSYVQHDLRVTPFPVPAAELVFARFLLTHLDEPAQRLRSFCELLAPGGRLLLLETSRLESEQPALARYYELVAALQQHYGQALNIGQELARHAEQSGAPILHFEERLLAQPASVMAELHALNLRTWSRDPAAQRLFDAVELARLGEELTAIASGAVSAPPVRAGIGLLVLEQR